MNEMQESQPSLHNKNPQKQQLTASKTIETKICKELTVCSSSRQTPINGSEAKKSRLAVHDVSKSYAITTSHKYVAKAESQQREELHLRILQTATTCSSSTLVPLEQSINTFPEGNIKQLQFNI